MEIRLNIREFYKEVGGDYDTIVEQLLKEDRVRKYINKYKEAPTFNNLEESLDKKDFSTAFMEVHNLKGMSINIGFVDLADACSELTESLRNGPKGDVEGLFLKVKDNYEKVICLISEIED